MRLSLLAVVLPAVLAGAVAAPAYDTYCNARYGYCLCYPPALLRPQGEAANGDGQVFRSPDGKASLRVWGENLVLPGDGLAARYAERSRNRPSSKSTPARSVSYRYRNPAGFVVSGTEGASIFYEKVLYRADARTFASFTFNYPRALAGTFDPATVRIAASFRF